MVPSPPVRGVGRTRTSGRFSIPLFVAFLAFTIGAASALGTVYVRDSTKHHRVHPNRLNFVFGAGTPVKFKDLKPWHKWGHSRTHASGIERYDDCKPSCAEGHIRSTHARVRLSHIHICHHRRVYGRIHVHPRAHNAPSGPGRITCAGNVLPTG
jgi:hypothetical protein